MKTIAEIKEEIRGIEAEMCAAMAEYKAAQNAYEEYDQNPANWNAPDFSARRAELSTAISEKAANTREIGTRLDAAKKNLFDHPEYPNPMRDFFAALRK